MPTTAAAEIFRQSVLELDPDQERGWVLADRKGQRSEWNLAQRQWKVSNIFVIQTWRLNLADLIGIPGLEVALRSIPLECFQACWSHWVSVSARFSFVKVN